MMALQIALEIKAELEAMGFKATIHGDDWSRHIVRIRWRNQSWRFDSLHEFKAWQEAWFDQNHGGS